MPRLLDLFCGAGGAAMGYSRAGFEVVGVDIAPQPRYPFDFIKADALAFMDGGGWWAFDAIHASPPCQAFSTIARYVRWQHDGTHAYDHPDLVEPTRDRLIASGLPYVMENVQGAPLRDFVRLCGSSFGLDVRRHRLFETGRFAPLLIPPCAHGWQLPRFITPYYGAKGRHQRLSRTVDVTGKPRVQNERQLREQAMGIDWMGAAELSQAIPPAYTEWIGGRLLEQLAG